LVSTIWRGSLREAPACIVSDGIVLLSL
jgi:hypothetical protein